MKLKSTLHLVIRYQFVPQMIFLNFHFGYLSLLIITKWCNGSQADLYHVMIYMFLSPTEDFGDRSCYGALQLQFHGCYFPNLLF
ncbi:hypothetical protein HRI_005058400 [Hibiscus trionum]|uniref:V-type proton ATPase subunit a n=1 Tax=Hibiscus trionum TaxID=183268 RepID=A0A9W7JIU2_HIBTR|nr:hypothetical protein HRI_005058400 [Hibiscus trionum]